MSCFIRQHAGAVTLTGLLATIAVVPPASASETELEPVIVTATRSAQADNPTASAVSIITREMIAASGARRIDDVLRGAAGVQLTDLYGDGSRTRVSLRGFGETAVSNVLILVDGRRLNNPDLAAPELASIALKDVERIEVLQGSAGSLYGDQAVGGVINIITRTPRAWAGNVAVATGSYDSRSLVATLSDRLANGFNYRLSSEKRQSDNYRDNNEIDSGNLFARAGLDYRTGSVFLEAQKTDEDLRLPGGLFRPAYDLDRRAPRYPNDLAESNTDNQRVGLRQALGAAWAFEAEATHRRTDVQGLLSNIRFEQSRTVREFTPRVVGRLSTASGPLQVTAGTDLVNSDYELSSVFGLTTNDQTMRAVYVQAILPLGGARHTLTLGARHARVDNDLRDSFSFPNGVGLGDDVTVKEIGFSTRLDDSWRVFVRRDENFRFAKVDEQVQTLGGITGLKTQTGVSYELGTEWRRQRDRFKAMIYRLDLEHEIDFDTSTYANVNLDPTRRDGWLLEAAYAVTPALELSANVAGVDASFRKGPYKGNTVPFVAERTANLAATWRFAAKWSAFAELHYIDDRFASGDLANDLEQLDGYVVGNIALRYERKHWTATLRVNNVADKEYADFAASSFNPATFANETAFYAAPERHFQATLQYRF